MRSDETLAARSICSTEIAGWRVDPAGLRDAGRAGAAVRCCETLQVLRNVFRAAIDYKAAIMTLNRGGGGR